MMMRRLAVFGVAATALLAILAAASLAYAHANQRQALYEFLDEALFAQRETAAVVEWTDPAQPLARNFTAVDERKIGKAVSEAWAAFAAAQDTGETGFLPDYFSGVALDRAQLAAATAHETSTRMVTVSLAGTPEFYHLDGSVFQARFEALTIRFAEGAAGLKAFRATRDTTVTTLMNESSGWRVYSHERTAVREVNATTAPLSEKRFAGLNYYPAQTPWRAFWSGFDLNVIENDFDRIDALGGNSVRVFLPRYVFLEPEPSDHLENLQDLLDAAEARGLSVVPTLFDLKGGYGLAGWANDAVYLQTVLPVLAKHPAVAFVDLKNEPDLDFDAHGRGNVEAWLRSMAMVHRQLAPRIPLTVGWSAAVHADVAADVLDLITYHDYAPINDAAARLAWVQSVAGNKPVIITEVGESAWSAMASFPGSPEKQAARLAERLEALSDAQGLFVWTLHDFPDPDPVAIGRAPWVRNAQAEFGLFDETGAPKPAAEAVARGFETFLKGHRND